MRQRAGLDAMEISLTSQPLTIGLAFTISLITTDYFLLHPGRTGAGRRYYRGATPQPLRQLLDKPVVNSYSFALRVKYEPSGLRDF